MQKKAEQDRDQSLQSWAAAELHGPREELEDRIARLKAEKETWMHRAAKLDIQLTLEHV